IDKKGKIVKKYPSDNEEKDSKILKEAIRLIAADEDYKKFREEYNAMSDSDKRKLHMKSVTKSSFMALLSNWDGSFPPLVEYTKKSLHNPDSFKHEETGFIIREEYIEVKMVYRAENVFGAMRRS